MMVHFAVPATCSYPMNYVYGILYRRYVPSDHCFLLENNQLDLIYQKVTFHRSHCKSMKPWS